ncbi:MAG: hypothetical protein M1541_04200 [Acidobacteria bacterium]|nr:hypothetical protein [Acidobacteriota bacterium]
MSTTPTPSPAVPQAKILGSIVCTPLSPRVGECVLVEVKAPDGHTYTADENVIISINTAPGGRQWLQFQKPGRKRVFVLAYKDGFPPEHMLATLEVTAPAGEADIFPILQIDQRLDRPYVLELRLEGVPQPKPPAPPARARLTAPAPVRVRQRNTAQVMMNTGEPPMYQWNFGDGKSDATSRGVISHDFGPSLSPDKVRQSFDLNVTVRLPDGRPVQLHRTVSIVNQYAFTKRRGVIQPRVTSDLNAVLMNGQLRAALTVENVEATPLQLQSRRIQPAVANGLASPWPAEQFPLTIAAKGKQTIVVSIPAGKLPSTADGFAVHFAGLWGRMPVRFSAFFDIPSRFERQNLRVSPETAALLGNLIAAHMVPASGAIELHDIKNLTAGGVLQMPRQGTLLQRISNLRPVLQGLGPRSGPVVPLKGKGEMPIAEGAECFPDDLPDNIPEGFVCQATEVTEWRPIPPRFVNAHKGDAILSPTGDTLIGDLLKAVNPPQLHSHSGIMTANYTQITHSTASQDRLMDYPNGDILGQAAPTNGHDPDALRYLWPGVITQNIQTSIDGEDMVDPQKPENTYHIGGFDPNKTKVDLGVRQEIALPLVVKPDPASETGGSSETAPSGRLGPGANP